MRTSHLPQTGPKTRLAVITMAVLFAALSLWSLAGFLDSVHLLIATVGSLVPLALVTDQIRRSRKHRHSRQAYRQWLNQGRHQISMALQSQHSLPELGQALLDEAAPYMGCGLGLFYYGYDEGLFLLEGSFGVDQDRVPGRARPESPVLHCADHGQPLILTSDDESCSLLAKICHPGRARTFLFYPLLAEEEPHAVLVLGLPGTDISPSLELLDRLAPEIVGALERVSSQEKTQELLRVSQAQAQALEKHRQQQQEKAEALERATHYKSRFLTNMSHELRSPLNSILLLAQMLEEKPAPADQVQENARIIQKCSRELLGLIEDILDLSKVEAGKLEYHLEPLDLSDLLFTIESSQAPLARRKNLDLRLDTRRGLPAEVVTDGKRLLQIARNLLANAIKFTEKGGITLTLGWESLPPPGSGGILVLAVADTGPGIPEDEQQTIFQEFEQAESTRDAGYGGTGLGLSISRRLAEDLGGSLDVLSSPGLGSTFTLRLPCALPRKTGAHLEEDQDEAMVRAVEVVAEAMSSARSDDSPLRPTPAPEPTEATGSALAGAETLVLGSDMRRLYELLSDLETAGARARAAGSARQGRLILDQCPHLSLLLVEGPLHPLAGEDLDRLLATATARGVPAVLRADPELVPDSRTPDHDHRFARVIPRHENPAKLEPARLAAEMRRPASSSS